MCHLAGVMSSSRDETVEPIVIVKKSISAGVMSSSRDETVEPIVIVEKSISVTSGEQIRPS